MLVIDVFDNAALLQSGRLETPGKSAVFLPEPLLIDEHAEALFEAKLAGIGGLDLGAEGVRHSVQFHRM
jgi:hypothetical protein